MREEQREVLNRLRNPHLEEEEVPSFKIQRQSH